MSDYPGNGDRNPTGTEPMPSPEFCEEFLYGRSEFMREYGITLRRYRMQDQNQASRVASSPTAYPPQEGSIVGDPGEQIWQSHNNPLPYSGFNQSSSAVPCGINATQQTQSTTRALEPSSPGLVHPADPASTGSGNRAAGSGAASIGSYLGSTSRRNREPGPLNENSSTTTPGSHRRKRVDTQTGKDKKPEKKHECKKCGKKFQSPAHLRSHDQIASHSPRGYRCKFCGTEFTREFSEKRHNIKPTPACMAARRASGASTLGSSSSVQSVSHVSAGSPSRTPYNAQDNMALSDGSTGPGNQQRPLVPKFHLPSRSPTNPPTTRSRNRPSQAAHTPPRPQPVTTAHSPPSRQLAASSTDPVPRNRRRPLVRALYPSSPTNPWNISGRSGISRAAHSQSLPVLAFYPPTPTNPRNTSGPTFSLLAAHAPSQSQDPTITQSRDSLSTLITQPQ